MKWMNKLLRRDRRRTERWEPTNLVAYYWDGSTPAPHRVFSLSWSGFQIETTSHWRRGTLITMTLQRVRLQKESVRPEDYLIVISRVIWSDVSVAGLQFIPQEQAGASKVQCVGKPSGKQVIEHFVKSCHPDFTDGTASARSGFGAGCVQYRRTER